MRPALFILGVALAGGAEAHPELGKLILQAALGLLLIYASLRRI